MKKKTGILYIVSTPIGNLGDITYRGVKILNLVNLIAAENIYHSKKLLNYYNINVSLTSYNEHNSKKKIPILLDKLKEGLNIALISDAGTPGISDPAYRLIRELIANKIRIEIIPGVSASIAGLVLSGLPTDRFLFEGFLPPKKGRKLRLNKIKNETATLIFFESPKRIFRTLNDLYNILGDRPSVICRELTKIHEEILRGKLSEIIKIISSKNKIKGECVILIGKDDENVYF